MTATAHALVGGAVAASIHNPALGLTISFASHPFLDMVPHWDFGWGWRKKSKLLLFVEAAGDLILGFVLAYLIFGQFVGNFWYFFGCVFAAEVWDIAEAPYWFLNWRFAPFCWIYNIQHNMQGKTKTVLGGIFNQVITISGIIIFLQLIPH